MAPHRNGTASLQATLRRPGDGRRLPVPRRRHRAHPALALAGVAQEVDALPACYQVLRIAITDATQAAGGIDPGRVSFTVALNAPRDLLTPAGTVIDLTGAIGRRVPGTLLPGRRPRVSPGP